MATVYHFYVHMLSVYAEGYQKLLMRDVLLRDAILNLETSFQN